MLFESFVNSERCKTNYRVVNTLSCLRALLIQKDAKHIQVVLHLPLCLRALLIQKDAKHG